MSREGLLQGLAEQKNILSQALSDDKTVIQFRKMLSSVIPEEKDILDFVQEIENGNTDTIPENKKPLISSFLGSMERNVFWKLWKTNLALSAELASEPIVDPQTRAEEPVPDNDGYISCPFGGKTGVSLVFGHRKSVEELLRAKRGEDATETRIPGIAKGNRHGRGVSMVMGKKVDIIDEFEKEKAKEREQEEKRREAHAGEASSSIVTSDSVSLYHERLREAKRREDEENVVYVDGVAYKRSEWERMLKEKGEASSVESTFESSRNEEADDAEEKARIEEENKKELDRLNNTDLGDLLASIENKPDEPETAGQANQEPETGNVPVSPDMDMPGQDAGNGDDPAGNVPPANPGFEPDDRDIPENEDAPGPDFAPLSADDLLADIPAQPENPDPSPIDENAQEMPLSASDLFANDIAQPENPDPFPMDEDAPKAPLSAEDFFAENVPEPEDNDIPEPDFSGNIPGPGPELSNDPEPGPESPASGQAQENIQPDEGWDEVTPDSQDIPPVRQNAPGRVIQEEAPAEAWDEVDDGEQNAPGISHPAPEAPYSPEENEEDDSRFGGAPEINMPDGFGEDPFGGPPPDPFEDEDDPFQHDPDAAPKAVGNGLLEKTMRTSPIQPEPVQRDETQAVQPEPVREEIPPVQKASGETAQSASKGKNLGKLFAKPQMRKVRDNWS